MTTPCRIRRATEADVERLPAIEFAADEIFAEAGIAHTPGAASVDALGKARLILVSGEPPVGFVRLEQLDAKAHVEQLSVHPSWMRRGIGAALVTAAIDEARLAGYPAITLTTFEHVPWNAPFYARHGFQPLRVLGPELRAHIEQHERGLAALGSRIAMIRPL